MDFAEEEDDGFLRFNDDAGGQQSDHLTINSSMSNLGNKGSFARQMAEFRRAQKIKYRSAQAALSEVKQFLCILYGACLRFYH